MAHDWLNLETVTGTRTACTNVIPIGLAGLRRSVCRVEQQTSIFSCWTDGLSLALGNIDVPSRGSGLADDPPSTEPAIWVFGNVGFRLGLGLSRNPCQVSTKQSCDRYFGSTFPSGAAWEYANHDLWFTATLFDPVN